MTSLNKIQANMNTFNKEQRITILNKIFHNLLLVKQWNINHPQNSIEYHYKALGLIELLEVDDCGSVGGYDKSNKLLKVSEHSPFNRFYTLVNKHNDFDNISTTNGIGIDELKDYFK